VVKPILFPVVCQQRTGSSVLRQFMASAKAAFDLGEIFHSGEKGVANFWRFIYEMCIDDYSALAPSNWHDMWQSYIARQMRQLKFQFAVFDLKVEVFNSTILSTPTGEWFFFPTVDMGFVFLERKNIAAQAISLLKAQKTNEWARLNPNAPRHLIARRKALWAEERPSAIPPGYLRTKATDGLSTGRLGCNAENATVTSIVDLIIPPEEVLHEIDRINEYNVWARRIMSKYEHSHIYYEDLFEIDGRFSEEAVAKISTIMKVPSTELTREPIFAKQADADLLANIINRDEILHRLSGTIYESMLATR
jgi:hypothetical protein